MKYFRHEIEILFDRLKSGKKFSFSKYADGEWEILNDRSIVIPIWEEFRCEDSDEYIGPRQALKNSFMYKDSGYYVGIGCPCCMGEEHYQMKTLSSQDDDQLTFANVFVNGNYRFFIDNFIPEFKNHDIHLIANENISLDALPFSVEEFYPVGTNAWVHDADYIDEILAGGYENKLFLFCCGPLGNILAHRLWEKNKNNVYLDIGSTLDPFWPNGHPKPRGYYDGSGEYHNKICSWGNN
jgi:hypothetical protein